MTRVPDLLVEQLHRGELSPERAAEVRQRLLREPGGAERLVRLADDDERTLAALPPEAFARRVRAKLASDRAVPMWAVPAFAMAAVLLVAGPLILRPEASVPEVGVTRTKGGADGLRVYRKGAGGAELLADHTPARAGDVIQLSYASNDPGFGVIFSVDGRGGVTLHFPESGDNTEIVPGAEVALPHGYALDDAPAFESFVMLRARHPIDVAAALQVARQTGGAGPWHDLAGDVVEVDRVVVTKVNP